MRLPYCMPSGVRWFLPMLVLLILGTALPSVAQWSDATTTSFGITVENRGMSWADFDGDGDLDLFVAVNGDNQLLRNDGEDGGQPGEWIFTEVAATVGLDDDKRASMGAWGDYDGDGDLDLYLSNQYAANILYRNDPLDPGEPGDLDRVFVNVSTGLLGTDEDTWGVAWVDYDRDGDVDLYLANDGANMLLRNDGEDPYDPGQWMFTDVATETGTANTDNSQSCAWGDFDADGDMDLYISNYNNGNQLLRNDPVDGGDPDDLDRIFVDVTLSAGVADSGAGRGVAWGDFDNDDDLDLYLANFSTPNHLWRNDGDGTFTEIAAAAGVADSGNGRGLGWFDMENDGDLDLYLVNYSSSGTENMMWRNDGPDGGDPDGWLFVEIGDTLLTDAGGYGATVAFADYDDDGDVDIALANWQLGQQNFLFRNDYPDTNSWLQVELTGRASNEFAVGAQVRAVAGATTVLRELSAGEGMLSQNSHLLEFGLGAATVIDTLEILWPSGYVQVETAVAVDQRIAYVEPGPDAPIMDAEPNFTAGASNTVTWSDESASGAVAYFMQASFDRAFSSHADTSGWTALLTHTTMGLSDGDTVYYRVRARDALGFRSNWSQPVSSAQDDAFPVSMVDPIDGPRAAIPFLVPYTATDLGSGIDQVELYVAFDDSTSFTLFDTITDGSPFLFDVASGVGEYYFYTIATDNLGNVESAPATYDAHVTIMALEWVDIAPSDGSGIANNGNGRGVAWGDYDGDGDPDLALNNRPVYTNSADVRNHLFRNDGPDLGDPNSWLFPDVTPSGMDDALYSQGGCWGDYDNDGDLDFYSVNMRVSSEAPNRLWRNDGGGSFTDVAASYGVDDTESGRTVSWVDYDADGDLDLYLCNNGQNHLWRNDGEDELNPGEWIFTDVAPVDGSGVGDDRYTMGCAWADFDGDGDDDLYLSNYYTGSTPDATNALLRNDGGDVFTDVSAAWGVDFSGSSTGCAWGDYDNDGLLDLYVTGEGPNVLYHRVAGSDLFEDVTLTSGAHMDDGQYGTGCSWADYDNDGDLDLYVGNHWDVSPDSVAVNFLFRNDGEDPGPGHWVFTNVAPDEGFNIGDDASTNGVAWADFDGDGDQDLYLASMTGESNRLFRNDTADAIANHWLEVDLEERYAGNTAVGSEVRAVVGGVEMLRRVDGGGSFLSQNSQTLHFGLGAAMTVDTLEIRWPDGYVQTELAIAADQRIIIEQVGPGTPTMDPLAAYIPTSPVTLSWSDESSSGAVEYEVIMANDALFTDVVWTSGWIANTEFTFTGGYNGLLRHYRARARDGEGIESGWSSGVFTTHDLTPPTSWAQAIVIEFQGTPFAVPFYSADAISYVDSVSLYYSYQSAPFELYGTYAPGEAIMFEIPDGLGEYSFYTRATDAAGNIEDAPLIADQTVLVTQPQWVNVAPTDGSGVGNDGNSRAYAWADYNDDGNDDLFISNRVVWNSPGESVNRLFRNEGGDGGDPSSWEFTDTTPPVLGDNGYGQGSVWGDFDGDGDLDLYMANLQPNAGTPAYNHLYRNDGAGAFTDISVAAGVEDGGDGRGASWIDFDQDGDLDLYLCNDGPNRLWRNDGPDTMNPDGWLFVNVAPIDGSGVGDDQYTMGCAWTDYDNDGDPDLYLTNYAGGTNRLLRNDGPDGVSGYWLFVDVASAMGVADTSLSLGCQWGDFDGDGWFDLYVTNLGPNRLYRNRLSTPDTPFLNIASLSSVGLDDSQYGAGIGWADYDNDGDLDLYVGNHWPDAGDQYAENMLFRNDGPDTLDADNWNFVNATPPGGYNIGESGSTNGVAWADFDRDGDLDLGMASMTGGQNRLFRNDVADSTDNHWVHLHMVGYNSNTSAVGARAIISVGGVRQMREVDGGSGFLSQASADLEFGLGDATNVDTLIVVWANGARQTFLDVAADMRHIITQSPTAVDDPSDGPPLAFRLDQNHPNPFNPTTTIAFELPTEGRARLAVYDLSGRRVRLLVDEVMPAGRYDVLWSGRDDRGAQVATGLYLYRLSTDEAVHTRKMLLLK